MNIQSSCTEAPPALGTPTRKHASPTLGLQPRPEAVPTLALEDAWLVGALDGVHGVDRSPVLGARGRGRVTVGFVVAYARAGFDGRPDLHFDTDARAGAWAFHVDVEIEIVEEIRKGTGGWGVVFI